MKNKMLLELDMELKKWNSTLVGFEDVEDGYKVTIEEDYRRCEVSVPKVLNETKNDYLRFEQTRGSCRFDGEDYSVYADYLKKLMLKHKFIMDEN